MQDARHKGLILHDSIYMKHPEQVNPQSQSADQCLPGDRRGKGEWRVNDTGFISGWWKYFGARQRRWLHNTVNVIKCHWIVRFKMVNFMLCEFHLNWKKKKKKDVVSLAEPAQECVDRGAHSTGQQGWTGSWGSHTTRLPRSGRPSCHLG